MIDDTPYIIVDNQKIAPIYRASKSHSTPAEKPNRENRPFGVVDRVTISREAMEKCRQQQGIAADEGKSFQAEGWVDPDASG